MVDTSVFSARLLRRASALDDLYHPILAGRPAVISFQTAAEVRHGAIKGGWGLARLRRLETRLAEVDIAWAGPELVASYAQLRADCERVGHALGQRIHDADRWVAATAIRLGLPIVAHDGVFRDVPGLLLETALPGRT